MQISILPNARAEEIKFIPSAIEFLRKKINNREDWIRCGLALIDLKEDGRKYFQQLSDNPSYKEDTRIHR